MKINSYLIMLILIFLRLVSVETVGAEMGGGNQLHSKVIYAFWPYWIDPSLYEPDWSVLNYVAYHSWDANSNGTLNIPSNINRFNTVKKLAHNNNVKIIISVKNFDMDTLDNIFAYHRDDLSNNISNNLQMYGADGVNLDFEFPRTINHYTDTSNKDLFEDLMKKIYAKVKSKNPDYYISINIAGSIEDVYRNANLSNYTDVVFLRGYNYHWSNSSRTGSPSPYNSIVNSVNDLKNYYPSNKIILGLYLSGYDWPSETEESGSNITGSGIDISMKNAIANADTYGRFWDYNSRTPYYKYYNNMTWHQVWYEDEQSLEIKLDYIKSENIGIGIWALGYEGNNASIWKIVREKIFISSTELPNKPLKDPKIIGFELAIFLIILLGLLICILIRVDLINKKKVINKNK
ncbi:Glycosyl hydrolases family 18 [uncultured archaeon]|nr:Glycosyl hydrolases family 18 [uncultured archaeon]